MDIRRSTAMNALEIGIPRGTGGLFASEGIEIRIRLTTASIESGDMMFPIRAGRDWISPRSQQVRLEHIIETVFAPDLETSVQAGGPDNLKFRSFWQKHNTALAGWFKMNGGEGLPNAVHWRGGSLDFGGTYTDSSPVRGCLTCCHVCVASLMRESVPAIQKIVKWTPRRELQ
jgi:hypothetical protein